MRYFLTQVLLMWNRYTGVGETEPFTVSRAAGSQFVMLPEEESAGLQVVDVILWLIKRFFNNEHIECDSSRLLKATLHRAYHHDFSFEGVGQHLEASFEEIMAADMSDEQIRLGSRMIEEEASRRQTAIEEYARDKHKRLS